MSASTLQAQEPINLSGIGESDRRSERVSLETTRHRIAGTLNLAPGYRSRLSDLLNAPERRFLALIDVVVEPLEGGSEVHHPFMAVARDHVICAVPVSEPHVRLM
jgi:hypothetical protein